MRAVPVVAVYAVQEALRRKIFAVVLLLTVAFVVLYWLGAREAVEAATQPRAVGALDVDATTVAAATLLGLAMFGTLFLGTVLAVFLTLGVVRGDAERGLLQPLVVRPLGRGTLLAARFAAAFAISVPYVLVVYAATLVVTRAVSGWWPDRIVAPGVQLALAVTVLAAISLLGSVFLSATANGIAVFMLFGAGLVAGLLGQIGEVLDSDTLERIARTSSWALPFEALYQDALSGITEDTYGLTRFAVDLGPFGGAQAAGTGLYAWVGAYLAVAAAAALAGFARRDL